MSIEKKLFDQMNETSAYWHSKSADLNSSAKVLWDHCEDGNSDGHYNIYKMLMGMSFEAMAKAFCMAKNMPLKTIHQIETLIADAGFQFDEIENKTLKVLTSYVEWAGKYPTPKDKKGTGAATLKEHWNDLSILGYEAFDYSKLHAMWRCMSDKYMLEHA